MGNCLEIRLLISQMNGLCRLQRYVLNQASARSEIPNVHRSLSSSMTWSTRRHIEQCENRDVARVEALN